MQQEGKNENAETNGIRRVLHDNVLLVSGITQGRYDFPQKYHLNIAFANAGARRRKTEKKDCFRVIGLYFEIKTQ